VFLKGNKVFEGKFEDEPLAWYFLAKGIFCSLSLVLLQELLELIRNNKPSGSCAEPVSCPPT
jgi:hypothetical protein